MRVDPLGDRAFILRDLGAPAFQIARWLNAEPPAGVIEAVASYDTVGVYVSGSFDPGGLAEAVDLLGTPAKDRRLQAASAAGAAVESDAFRTHRIPVCYEMGEDLDETAGLLGMTADEVAACHLSTEYTCYAVGFCPGFGYLGYLPDAIQGVPRRPSPRTRIEPGSVGITGRQTGVYPLPRPGGWALIGRTPLTLVNVADEYFPIQAGDTIIFERIGLSDFKSLQGEWL